MSIASSSEPAGTKKFKRSRIGISESLGELLRKKREEQKLSIETCAIALHIQAQYLTAIESGKYELLPGEMYAKGWIKKYAAYLNLPDKETLKQYSVERFTHNPKKPHIEKTSTAQKKSIFHFITLRRILISGAAIIVAGYLIFALYQSFSPPEVTFENLESDFRTQENSIIIKGQTEPNTSLTINDQSISINENGIFEQEINLIDGIQTITISAKKAHSRTFIKEVRVLKATPPNLIQKQEIN